MTLRTLIGRSLRFHWRLHLGVVLGSAVASAALVGALVVGDSVRGSLLKRALERLGWVQAALDGGDRLFPQTLARRVVAIDPASGWRARAWHCEAVLRLAGLASRQDGSAHAHSVNVLGVGYPGFWQGGLSTNVPPDFALIPPGCVLLNQPLAVQLRAGVGDEIVLRLHRPTALSPDAAIAPRSDSARALRLKVHGIAPADHMGCFSLRATATPPLNAFLPIEDLASAVGLNGKANVLLLGDVQPAAADSAARVGTLWERLRHSLPGQKPGPGGLLPTRRPANDWHVVWAAELEDYSLEVQLRTNPPAWELRSRRVFLEPPVTTAFERAGAGQSDSAARPAQAAGWPPEWHPTSRATNAPEVATLLASAQPLLTYLANALCAGSNVAPYSMITAAGPPWTPSDMRDDEILVSSWLAEDLHVQPGDEIALAYFDPESGAQLLERTNRFRVRGIVPMQPPWADPTLMPDFPGIEKAESTRDWDAGFPIVYRIRPKDEDYWRRWRGTPKAFVTLAAGQKMWANRFGNLTAIRFPLPPNAAAASDYRAALERLLLTNLKPEELGLRFEPARRQAVMAATQSQDFAGLFLGFSLFLIAAALLLMALLFSLGLEQRAQEIGTLLALGFTPAQVRNLLLAEGALLALLGGLLGAPGGLAYARAMLSGLATVWRDAVGGAAIEFHVTGRTLLTGLVAGVGVGSVTVGLALRRLARTAPTCLLAGALEFEKATPREAATQSFETARGQIGGTQAASGLHRPHSWRSALGRWWQLALGKCRAPASNQCGARQRATAWLALTGAGALVGRTIARGDTSNAEAFFGAGALVLLAGLGFASARLAAGGATPAVFGPHRDGFGQTPRPRISLRSLGLRGCARRRGRSLAVVAMLACAVFLIVSVGVFRQDAGRGTWRRTSGTGGFALVARTAMPVAHDLNSAAGRAFFALREEDMAGVSFVPFRVHEGDEASCLSLNRAQRPRLLGVRPELLEGRFTFARGIGWGSLGVALADRSDRSDPSAPSDGVVPAIGDANSVRWALGKRVGDTLDYVDERGRPFKVRIVGAVANSILQGSLLIDEAEFVKRFPGESGYRFYLVGAPSNRVAEVSALLSRALQDVGLEVMPASERLAQFNAVQNTYLGTFQVLGGLGLLLGSAGLGIVVLRNVLERRGELAVLLAVGFRKRTLQRLLLIEHGALLVLGLVLGLGAAAVAVLPALLAPGEPLPWRTLGLTLLAVLCNSLVWTAAAALVAVRGELLSALRNA